MYNDKTLKSVAEAVKQVMEAELSAKQKAIAKISEPKHKIDAGDLAKLRAGHKPVKEAVVKGKGYDNPENERKAPEGHVSMTSLMPGHDERAAKFLARQAKGTLVKGKAQSAPQKEPGMKKEEVEQIEEGSDTLPVQKMTSSFGLGRRKSAEVATQGSRKGLVTKKHATSLKQRISSAKNLGVNHGPMSKLPEEASQDEFNAEIKKTQAKSQGKVKANVAKPAVQAVKQESVEQVDERTLTAGEMEKREKYAKSMKKGLQGFKQRYGERAKEVMYATATKMAKKD